MLPGEKPQLVRCRMRSLGCSPCTGAIRSDADTVPKIIEEMMLFRRSERENRGIDHDREGSMELKKWEGCCGGPRSSNRVVSIRSYGRMRRRNCSACRLRAAWMTAIPP